MKVGDILRITAPLRPESGKCYKIKNIYTSKYNSEQRYVTESGTDFSESVVESARTTEFKVDMVVKLNERGVEYGSTKKGLQLSKDSYARVIEIGEFHIKIQRVTPNNTLATNRYHRIHLDICPHMSYWYEKDTVKDTQTLTFFEGPAKKPTVVSALKVGDKVRVNKPRENKYPNRINDMNKHDNTIVTIKSIGGDILRVKESDYNFHQDRCTPVATETSGLLPHLPSTPGRKHGVCTMYIDEAMAKKHRDLMDDYIHKQTADIQGWQHQYLLSLSKTKPMTDTLKELRFEDYTKKNLKDIVASSEMLDDTLQKLCTLRRRISGFESFVDRTLVSLDRAYENHDKEAIASLLKQASIINKVVNSDLYKATVTGLEGLEKLDKHFEA